MNIGIDIRPLMSPNRTGVGEYTYELLNALFKIDHQNQYFLFYNSLTDASDNIPKWPYDNVKYIHTKWPNKLFNLCQKFFKYPKIDKLIGQKIDYFFSPNLNFTSLSEDIKYILTIHDLSFELYPQYYSLKRRLWHKIINAKKQSERANIILTPSQNTKLDLINYFRINPDKITTLYPGLGLDYNKNIIDEQKLKQKYNLPDNFILYLGTVEPRKNLIGLIKAFGQFQSNTTSPHWLIIAGARGWKNGKIYKTAKCSKYKDYIKFIGYIEPSDKPLLYSLAKVFIYPSLYEGFGFPVLEAMRCGVPVITSNRSSLLEISNKSSYLVNPNKINEIALAIKKLVENDQLREYYIAKGIRCVEKYNWKNAATKFLKQLT